eukprot:23089-Prorocentrum_lima.AAC.1
MCENITEDLNEDEYEAPTPLDPNDPTPPSSPGSSHWTRSAKNWELVSRLKESALASIEGMEEAGRKFQDMEYDFTLFDSPKMLVPENIYVPIQQ